MILLSQTKTETVVVSYFFGTHQKMKLTIQGKQCHIIYQVNKIVMENVQFNYFTDFGLANFAISNLKILKPLSSDGDLSEGSIQCDDNILSWKLISRNADSRPGFEKNQSYFLLYIDFKPFERIQRIGDECELEISDFTTIDRPGLYDLAGMVKWNSFFN